MAFYKSCIKLKLGDLEVSFDRFSGDEIPRVDQSENPPEFTASGVAVIRGVNYEPKSIWNVTAFCDRQDYLTLLAIWAESDRRRREFDPLEDFQIELYDTTFPVVENGAPTRAIVPETEVVLIPDNTPVYSSYYAVFNVVLNKRPDFRFLGGTNKQAFFGDDFELDEVEDRRFFVTFTAYETSKTIPEVPTP